MCLTRGGIREGDGGGDCVGEKPAEMKACNGGPCVPISMWYSSPWAQVDGWDGIFFFFFYNKYVRD